MKLKTSSAEVTVGGSYYLYKHLTSIKKRQEEKTAHTHRTEHLREMTRRGQHSTPQKKLGGQEKRKNEGGKRDNDTTVSWVKFRARCMLWSCRTIQHYRRLCWTATRWVKECVGGGGAGQ